MRRKTDIRRVLIPWRKGLSSGFVAQTSKIICDSLKSLDTLKSGNVMLYMPHANEVDVSYLFDFIGDRLYLPFCDGDNIVAVKYSGEFSVGSFGVFQPVGSPADCSIDAVITPAVAFDPHGYRVGWGKGYFDRFFAANADTYKIGVGYDRQVVKDFKREPHDIPVDIVITEKGIYR